MGKRARQSEQTAEAARKEEIKPRNIGRTLVLGAAVVLLLLSAAITFAPAGTLPGWRQVFLFFGVSEPADRAMEQYPFTIQFLDVGKADSILITCEGQSILVDTGDVSVTPRVAEYLQRRGVKKLDYVIATHPDNDHIGGLAEVLSRFEVGRFLMPGGEPPASPSYREIMEVCRERGIPIESPSPGDELALEGLSARIMAPLQAYDGANNNSIVIKLTYGEIAFLLTGDAEKESEQAMLFSGEDLRADVLKVGHHGSPTSTTRAFLEAVRPRYAVISVGEDRNNLPKDVVLERLEEAGAELFRTDFQGTVIAATDGETIEFFTER